MVPTVARFYQFFTRCCLGERSPEQDCCAFVFFRVRKEERKRKNCRVYVLLKTPREGIPLCSCALTAKKRTKKCVLHVPHTCSIKAPTTLTTGRIFDLLKIRAFLNYSKCSVHTEIPPYVNLDAKSCKLKLLVNGDNLQNCPL